MAVWEWIDATKQDLMREPVRAVEIGGLDACISSAGDLRTLPFHLALEPPQIAGMDGFYAARLRRLS